MGAYQSIYHKDVAYILMDLSSLTIHPAQYIKALECYIHREDIYLPAPFSQHYTFVLSFIG